MFTYIMLAVSSLFLVIGAFTTLSVVLETAHAIRHGKSWTVSFTGSVLCFTLGIPLFTYTVIQLCKM